MVRNADHPFFGVAFLPFGLGIQKPGFNRRSEGSAIPARTIDSSRQHWALGTITLMPRELGRVSSLGDRGPKSRKWVRASRACAAA